MAILYMPVTFNVHELGITDPVTKVRATVDVNVSGGAIHFPADNLTFASGSVFTFEGATGTLQLPTRTGGVPEAWEYRVTLEVARRGGRPVLIGPLYKTATADHTPSPLASWADTGSVPESWMTAATAQLTAAGQAALAPTVAAKDTAVAAAATATTAASTAASNVAGLIAADRTAVATDRAYVETIVTTDLETSDGQMAALDASPTSQFRVQQDARLNNAIGDRLATPGARVAVNPREAVAPIAQTPVSITTYVGGSNEIVHPSVLHFPGRWNGWAYWMAYTPYNNGDAQYENPCIAVSNDGTNWSTPAGLTNPLDPDPGAPAYHSDTNISMLTDGRMLLIWRLRDGSNTHLLASTSRNGVTWTPKVTIGSVGYDGLIAPVVQWNGKDYTVWTVENSPNPNILQMRRVADPTAPGALDAVTPLTCVHSLPPSVDIWHFDIIKHGGTYFCVVQGVEDGGWYFFFGTSLDGYSWDFAQTRFMRKGAGTASSFYKASIQPLETPDGLGFDMWYTHAAGSPTTYVLHRTQIDFGRTRRSRERTADLTAACMGLAPWSVGDSFNRANTTAGLGTSTSGAVWTSVLGNPFGITSGMAYLPTAANSRSIVEVGVARMYVEAEFTTLGASGYLIARYIDTNNLWRIGHLGNALVIQKIVAGVATSLPNHVRVEAGDVIGVEFVGTRLRVYLNRVLAWQLTDSDLVLGTKAGLSGADTVSRWRGFLAIPAPA